MNSEVKKAPTTFWIIAVIGLLWNAFGVYNWITQSFMMDSMLASIPEEQHVLYENVPIWISIVFGIAVILGTLACIGLLMRKKWAVPLFLVSLVAIIIQMVRGMIQPNVIEILGVVMAIVFPIIVILVGVLLYYYSMRSRRAGWIS